MQGGYLALIIRKCAQRTSASVRVREVDRRRRGRANCSRAHEPVSPQADSLAQWHGEPGDG